MTAPEEVLQERYDDWNDNPPKKRPSLRDVPEPPELAEQAAAAKAQRAKAAEPCAQCDQPRSHNDHIWTAGQARPNCRYVERSTP